MTKTTSRTAKWTAVVIAIGGFLAAYADLRDYTCATLSRCKETKTVTAANSTPKVPPTLAPVPVIPEYKTDWVTGGGGDPYCQPRLAAYREQYPYFNITVYEPQGEHTSSFNWGKQDRYRYTCIFTATPKSNG